MATNFVARSKCWLRDFLNRKTELREGRQPTLQDVELAARRAGIQEKIDNSAPNSIALHRLLNILHLGKDEVIRREPDVFHHLLHTCLHCARSRECMRGFKHSGHDELWPHYCPNALTLRALLADPG